jgi:hypothetical protein
MIPSRCGGRVGCFEIGLECGPGVFGHGFEAPNVAAVLEETCSFDDLVAITDGGSFGDWVTACQWRKSWRRPTG